MRVPTLLDLGRKQEMTGSEVLSLKDRQFLFFKVNPGIKTPMPES